MDALIIRGTAWAAILLFVAREAAAWRDGGSLGRPAARWLSLAGCAVFIGHILVSFHWRHGWSHAGAVRDTARQTAELTGWNWGGGIYLNYLFAAMWCWEAGAAWLWPEALKRRSRAVEWSFRGFYLFMMANAAVVFVPGPARWLGAACCLALAALWLTRGKSGHG
jgi:hypothetical protein